MLDLASPEDPNIALKLASLVKEFKPYWFEEPVDGEATRSLKYIKNQTGLRIVTGEKQCGINHFVETLAADAIDIFNPDISSVGGIIDMIKIIELSNTITALPAEGVPTKDLLNNLEANLIRTALEQTDGNVSRASELLQLGRTSLIQKINKYQLGNDS